jgi:hypothetical protein
MLVLTSHKPGLRDGNSSARIGAVQVSTKIDMKAKFRMQFLLRSKTIVDLIRTSLGCRL